MACCGSAPRQRQRLAHFWKRTGHAWSVRIAKWVVSHAELHLHNLRDSIRRERPSFRYLLYLPGRPLVRQTDRPELEDAGWITAQASERPPGEGTDAARHRSARVLQPGSEIM